MGFFKNKYLTQCARKKVPTQDIKITFLDDFFRDARDGCLVHSEQKKNFIAHLAGHGGRFKSNFGPKWPFWTSKKTPYSLSLGHFPLMVGQLGPK